MIRVLFFVDRLRFGGIQALLLDVIKHYDRSRYTIEILNLNDGIDYPLTAQMKDLGVTIHRIDTWIRTPLDFPNYFSQVDKFFVAHHDYDAVHLHSSSKNYYILKCAKKWGIPVRIAHSHNTGFQSHNPVSILLGDIFKGPLKKYATDLVGCSTLACQWLFGKNSVSNGKAKVILNAISVNQFVFNQEVRDSVRKELGIEDKFVIGHIGRFEKQKNHEFLIDVFSEISKKREDAVLVLVGIGSLMEEMKQKVQALGLDGKVLFLGFRSDSGRLLQAMDSFVFPSFYEGLSVVLIEAQTAGLPIFVSDTTSREVAFSKHICYLSISDTPLSWAEKLLETGSIQRKDMTMEVNEHGFNLDAMMKRWFELYSAH